MTPFLHGFAEELVKVSVALAPAAKQVAATVPRRPPPTGGFVASRGVQRMQGPSKAAPQRYRPSPGAAVGSALGAAAVTTTPGKQGGGGRQNKKPGQERQRLPFETNPEMRSRLAREAAYNKKLDAPKQQGRSGSNEKPLPHTVQGPFKPTNPGILGSSVQQRSAYAKAQKSMEGYQAPKEHGPPAPVSRMANVPRGPGAQSAPNPYYRPMGPPAPSATSEAGAVKRMEQQKLKLR